METQEQFELRKAKALAKLRIIQAKDKFVYKRQIDNDIVKRIARWEAWTYEKDVAYHQRKAQTQNA